MIVRNEAKIIERALRSVADHVACWVICDTGSTDATRDRVESFFGARGIPGRLHEFPFENFEQARNAALQRAVQSEHEFDYLLLMDADMELVVSDPDFRQGLGAPAYRVLQRSGISYWNTRLLQRGAPAQYRGVTHERLAGVETEALDGVWFIDHADGASRPDKFGRDLRLLQDALAAEPDNARSVFYLAQTYRDLGRFADAAEAYARRVSMGGPEEEAWYALLQEARARLSLGDEAGFMRVAQAAHARRPHRAEPLYDLARFHRKRGDYEAAVRHCEAGLAIPWPASDRLFIEDFVYNTGLKEELALCGYSCASPERQLAGRRSCFQVAIDRRAPEQSQHLARHCQVFYVEAADALLPTFQARRIGVTPEPGYLPTNPSVALWQERLWVLVRGVNYRDAENNNYRTPANHPVHTRNYLACLDDDLQVERCTELLAPADFPEPKFRKVLGCEDGRLIVRGGELWGVFAVRQFSTKGWFEMMLARIGSAPFAGDCVLHDWHVMQPTEPRRHQKNWMPLVTGDQVRFVHSVDPTRIVDENGGALLETTPGLALDHLRGGSQAISFDDGWLVLVHEVPMLDRIRYYLHRFVLLGMDGTVLRVSEPFYFARLGIEFAAGLAWHPDGQRLVLSYGIADEEAWLATVAAADVRSLLETGHRP